MEELLQSVTSVRKGFEERRKSRLPVGPINAADLMLHLSPTHLHSLQKASLKPSSKTPKEVSSISTVTKLNLDEFSRYLKSPLKSQGVKHKLSPGRKRTYKLDAANLLVSRIKLFLSKHLKHWKKYTEMLKANERKITSARALVVKVKMGNLIEKERYLSREKASDDEVTQKANTSRHSPRSPIWLDFTQAKPRAFHRNKIAQTPPEIEDLRNKRPSLSNSKNIYPMPGEKILPLSTRVASSFSLRKLEKAAPRPVKGQVLEKIVRVLAGVNRRLVRESFSGLAEYVQKCTRFKRFLSLCAEKLRQTVAEVFEGWKEYNRIFDVAIGSKILTVMYLNKIADIFHFMKFRCVIESGIFDESMGESSEEQFKNCLDSSDDTALFKNVNRGKSLSYLLYIQSFTNLMNSLEQKVRFRYYGEIEAALLQYCEKTGESNAKHALVLSKNKSSINEQACFNVKLQKYALNSIFRNTLKDMTHKYMRCIEQWKLITFRTDNYDRYKLEVISFNLQISKLVHERLKLIFNSIRISKYRVTRPKKDLKNCIIKGVARIERYLKTIKKTAFFEWKLHEPTEIFQEKSTYKVVNYFVKVLEIKLSTIFVTIRNNGSLMRKYKYVAIKQLCSGFRSNLSKNFSVWKSIPDN